jgi:hypothetical protein
LNLPCQAPGRRMDGCAEWPDSVLSLVYSRKWSLFKIEWGYKKSSSDNSVKQSVCSFGSGRNSLFPTFRSPRRMTPFDFTSSGNFLFVTKIDIHLTPG